jgi:hypothetical protein
MSHAPPVPEANQSPFPRHDPPITHTQLPPTAETRPDVRDTINALPNRAVSAAKARPYAAAALIGTVALAVLGSLRRIGSLRRKRA